ncbi:MAG: glycosyltransferase family 4 protein [Anaerolineae bacterium]|jgi:glycosyltransferase involved in cell wall biosynthesis|nr:glycosyltransferase family 4 protein [Anaerolineae bacterium]MBT7192096.1 glycosyltransferase family 4 protein [Anaerolineae bacterium]MBT7990172.1 glycosyltransferase family 4 protein [Anaerolineae bacterium]
MHILIIHQAFAALNEPGGTRHHELARYLVQRGHRVTIIASPVSYITGEAPPQPPPFSSKTRGEPEIVRAYVYQAHHKSFVHRVLAFLSFMASSFFVGLKVKDVDLIWGTSPPIFQGITAWALSRLKRIPFLFEVRDLWPAFAISVGVLKNGILIGASEWLERFLYRGADRVMVNSPGYVQHVKDLGAKRVELVPNGADAGMFDPVRRGADFRQSHLLSDKFVVLYAGAHGFSNDLGVVLDAAKKIEKRPIQIVLLGDGKEKASLQAKAKEMELRNVSFVDSVPKSEMANALAASDACLAILKPIEWYKATYPNKVFDYMAAGRPIVLAIDGVIREVVDAAGCGVFAEPGDTDSLAAAILSLAKDDARSREMGLVGRAYIEAHFDRAALAEKLTELLEEMVGEL